MTRRFVWSVCAWLFVGWLLPTATSARTYTDAEGRTAWIQLRRQPVTEATFRQTCDLIQDMGQTNLPLAYDWLKEYMPVINKTGNRRWLHVLLINWGKAYESLNHFTEAEPLFRQARQNAQPDPKMYGQVLVYTVILYLDWNKLDSAARYIALGEQVARSADDRETLAFMAIFRASVEYGKGHPEAMRRNYDEAIRLAADLPDKNALFIARHNKAVQLTPNPIEQSAVFDSLLRLSEHPSLRRKPRFYERTTFYFRNPRPTVLYNLVQLNLLLADYDNAGKFADMVYDELIRPNPGSPSAPSLRAEIASVRAQQGCLIEARALLDSSRIQYGGNEAQIPYPGYFLAAGMLAEKTEQWQRAAEYYRKSLANGNTAYAFSRIPPELFYARSLVRLGRYELAQQQLDGFAKDITANPYTSIGLYYFQTMADLDKAQGKFSRYAQATDQYHNIRDSLTNLNQYRAVQQILAQVRIRDKEQQISRLNAENVARQQQLRRERLFYGVIIALAVLTIVLLALYLRNRQIRARQREALQQGQLEQLEKQRRIDLMQGVMKAEANERLTIADQLHNEVNPLLAVVLLNLSSALEAIPANSAPEPKLRRAQDMLAAVTSTVRGISHQLTPQLIEKQGFKRAVEELVESVNLSEKVRIKSIVVGFDTPLPLPFLSDLYRIVQELVHNVIRHAGATEATVEVIEHDRYISILIDDNGVGIAADPDSDGQGLRTIRDKVSLRNGQMDVQRKPDGGTLIVIDNLEVPTL